MRMGIQDDLFWEFIWEDDDVSDWCLLGISSLWWGLSSNTIRLSRILILKCFLTLFWYSIASSSWLYRIIIHEQISVLFIIHWTTRTADFCLQIFRTAFDVFKMGSSKSDVASAFVRPASTNQRDYLIKDLSKLTKPELLELRDRQSLIMRNKWVRRVRCGHAAIIVCDIFN